MLGGAGRARHVRALRRLRQALSVFSSRGQKEEKLRFAFKVYDVDRDGFISNGELFQVSRAEQAVTRGTARARG